MGNPVRRLLRALLCILIPAALATSVNITGPAANAQNAPKVSSVGVYPTAVTFPQALRGGEYLQTIGVINGTSISRQFRFYVSGEAAPWLQVVSAANHTETLKSLYAPASAKPSTAVLVLRVPSTMANGTYHAEVAVSTPALKATGKGQTTVGLGAVVDVNVEVTGTQVVSGYLVNVYASYPKVEVGQPLRVFAVIKNSGNVAEQPRFTLAIAKAHTTPALYRWNGTTGPVLWPAQTSTYEVTWPGASTETQTLGHYAANVTVSFPGKKVGTWALPFQLVPYGSLHRGGKLLGIKLLNHPAIGAQAEVQASVESSGEVQQETNFVGQLYRNGVLVQAIKSPVPILLQPGEKGVLTMPVPVAKDGLYRLTGSANFAGAQTPTKTLSFRVGPKGLPVTYEIGAAGGAVLVVLLLLVFLLVRRGRRRTPPSLPYPYRGHVAPRYTATHPRALHVPPRDPVGSGQGRSGRSRRN